MREKNRSGRGKKHPSGTEGKGAEQGSEAAKSVSGTEKPATAEDKASQTGNEPPATSAQGSTKGGREKPEAAPPGNSGAKRDEPPPPAQKGGGGCAATTLALLALAISLGVGGAGYYLWQQLQTGQQQTEQNLQQSVTARLGEVSSTLQQQTEQKLSTVEQQMSSLKGELKALGERQQELRALQQETTLQEMAALNEKLAAIGSDVGAAQQRLTELATQQQGVSSRLGEAEATLQRLATVDEAITALEERIAAATSRQQHLLDSIAELQIQADQERNSWKLTETEYLLNLATRRLTLEQDITGAMAALQAADGNLASIGEARWLPVREAISSALTELQALPRPDTDGAAVTITALDRAVEQLPLQQPERQLKSTALDTEPLHEAEDLQGWGNKVWESVKKLVIIRHGEKPAMAALLPPDQAEYLRQNLHLKLESARYALLRNNPELFRKSLATAREWIEAHFDAGAEATRGMLESLRQLEKMEFPQTLPDISAPLEQLRKLRSRAAVPQPEPPQEEQPATEPPELTEPTQPEAGQPEQPAPEQPEPAEEQQETEPAETVQQEPEHSPDAAVDDAEGAGP